MKRFVGLVLGLLIVGATIALAAETTKHANMGASMGAATTKASTWKGEVLDAGCYLGHGAMGAKHQECALKCASNGMPLMLLVNGKALLLTPNHDNADPYNQLKTLAGSQVVVTGTMASRGGVSGIDVTAVEAVK